MKKQYKENTKLDVFLKRMDSDIIRNPEWKNKTKNQLLSSIDKFEYKNRILSGFKLVSSIGVCVLFVLLLVGYNYYTTNFRIDIGEISMGIVSDEREKINQKMNADEKKDLKAISTSEWEIPGLEEARSVVPFEIDLPDPSLIPQELKEKARTETKKINIPNRQIYHVNTFFGGPQHFISVSQTEATEKPPFLSKLRSKMVDNVNVYVEEIGEDKYKTFKMYFWNNDMYYLVKGENVNESQLDNIISSILNHKG
jgi:hypothetical protein